MDQIQYEGWDPYSADMTLEEFYALMELFQEGTLPLKEDTATVDSPLDGPAYAAPGFDEPGTEEPTPTDDGVIIPRTMFLFSGLKDYEGDNAPLDYDNENGNESGAYPPHLDDYNLGYLRPPMSWSGVGVTTTETGGLQAAVIVKGQNDTDPTIAGNVDQSLFQPYIGYYVRRVTAEGVEVSILGVIKKESGEYVYYYMSADDQNTQVSSTTLPEGQKFIVQYVPLEHAIQYKVEMTDGSDVTEDWVDSIFGTDRLDDTVEGKLNFAVTGPYYYTTQIFLETEGSERVPLTGVSTSWPLGTEPQYTVKSADGFSMEPDTRNGPSAIVYNDVFRVDNVSDTSTLVAVLTPKGVPQFDAATIITNSDGTPNRGSTATRFVRVTDKATGVTDNFPYDYEDEYLYRNGLGSKYDNYPANNNWGGNSCNIIPGGGWNWGNNEYSRYPLTEDGNGAYFCQWTFQTNSGDFLMDTLSINGTSVSIPFFPKYKPNDSYNATLGTNGGTTSYVSQVTLPDGAVATVEFLMVFGSTQRVYRITVAGSHSNVTITAMNLMMYTGGNQEFSANVLDGVHADEAPGGTQDAVIQYYNKESHTWARKTRGNIAISVIDWSGDTSATDQDGKDHLGANIRFKLKDGYASPYFLWEETNTGQAIDGTDGYKQGSATKGADGSVLPENQNDVLPWLSDGTNIYMDYINGKLIPVTSEGNRLYKADGTLVESADEIEFEDGGLVLITELYTDTEKSTPVTANDVLVPAGSTIYRHLDSQHIYGPDADGWYYIRVSTQWDFKVANLTIVARPVKYVIRYMPGTIPAYTPKDGEETIPAHDPENMPTFEHYENQCHWSFFWDNNNGIPGEQYDDYKGYYYDVATYPQALISNTQPTDPGGYYKFVDWVLVGDGDDPQPVKDAEGNEIHFPFGGSIDINAINEYAILNGELGGADTDVDVLRLMPTWQPLSNPFKYSVVLDWVDAQGNLHQEHFKDYWADILTESPGADNSLTVYVNTTAGPLLDWIAQHPTYTFWDAVNTAVDDPATPEKEDEIAIKNALDNDIPALEELTDPTQRQKVLDALLNRDISGDVDEDGNPIPNGTDDFSRLGGYSFAVHEDSGTIVIWMCENRGGLVFRKDVQEEPLIYDDEFYFTVDHVLVGGNGSPLEGTYKAYPEIVYDEVTGEVRDRLDSDAWLVKFENGSIVNIVKNDGVSEFPDPAVTYFTVKHGEGVMLYVPAGRYTVTELGSKSGGSYMVKGEYDGDERDDPDDDWDIPEDDKWLKGSDTIYHDPEVPGVSQVSATVNFKVGERNVVHTLIFHNQTNSLSIEKQLGANDDDLDKLGDYADTEFKFEVTLTLLDGYEPLEEDGKYYFNTHLYTAPEDGSDGSFIESSKIWLTETEDGSNVWTGKISLKAGQRAVIVMQVPEQTPNTIDYKVEELDVLQELTPMGSPTQGTIDPGIMKKVTITNWYGDPPGNGFLVITEKGGDPNESFLYKITDENGHELIVSVKGGGQTIVECPAGTYTVVEITDWAWRYENGKCTNPSTGTNTATVEVTGGNTKENPVHADFKNERNDKVWLDGESSKDNLFAVPTSNEETESVTLDVNDDEKKKRFYDGRG